MKFKLLKGNAADQIRLTMRKLGTVPFIFANPPANYGRPAEGWSTTRPLEWADRELMEWMEPAWDMLAPGGCMAIHCHTDHITDHVLDTARSWGWRRCAWVIWQHSYPYEDLAEMPDDCTGWPKSHSHLLVYTKDEEPHQFNAEDVAVEDDLGDPVLPGTVWDIPIVDLQARSHKKGVQGLQLPIDYVERVLLAYTDIADTVFDVHGTGGVVAEVALRNKRNVIVAEPNQQNQKIIEKRIKGLT